MKDNIEILKIAKKTFTIESEAILGLSERLSEDFCKATNSILLLKGRVIITGVGKSAIIAQKIVATLNSTGTPSLFMHAADAVHGDLGMIQTDDLIICISKSGNTPEIKLLLPLLKQGKNTLVAIVGDTTSYLAKNADLVLDTTVKVEACPNNLAPTTSTTAQLAMGDALAVSLLECREFTSKDFARFHPGGALGKKLYLKVSDLSDENPKPVVNSQTPVKEVLLEITKNRVGAVAVIDANNIIGIITDGDIRRMIENHDNFTTLKAGDIMGRNPKSIDKDQLAINALEVLRSNNITQVLVTSNNKFDGILHLHDLLREGII